ncbi:hypothetical protein ABK040_016292 [Willaertia magna]
MLKTRNYKFLFTPEKKKQFSKHFRFFKQLTQQTKYYYSTFTTVKDALIYGENKLSNLKFKNLSHYDAEGDVRQLLLYLLKRNRKNFNKRHSYLLLDRKLELTEKECNEFKEMIERRSKYEPIEYITNEINFYGRNFYVNSNVLIPRNDSEILVETSITSLLPLLKDKKEITILEIGVGSGCLLLSTFLEFEKRGKIVRAIGLDKSKEAIQICKENTSILLDKNQQERITLVHHDIFNDSFDYNINNGIDILISNPPYLSQYEYDNEIDLDVKNFEPSTALIGGEDGLLFYKYILNENTLKNKYKINSNPSFILLEIGHKQLNDIIGIISNNNNPKENSLLSLTTGASSSTAVTVVDVVKDLNGINRVLVCKVQ